MKTKYIFNFKESDAFAIIPKMFHLPCIGSYCKNNLIINVLIQAFEVS